VPRSDAARARTPRNVGANLAAGSPPFFQPLDSERASHVHAFPADSGRSAEDASSVARDVFCVAASLAQRCCSRGAVESGDVAADQSQS
jgi:hypothetical protein